MRSSTRWRLRRAVIPLLITAAAAASILGIADRYTRERISQARAQTVLRQLREVMPAAGDNDVVHDVIEVTDRDLPGGDKPAPVYRARRGGEPLGVAIAAVAPDGYNGAIRLLVGIRYDGALLGVRVLEQHETPGIGDQVDPRNSDWLSRFAGRSLGNPPAPRWAVRPDGGDFDVMSGATITSRAVTKAVRRVLEYYQLNRDHLY